MEPEFPVFPDFKFSNPQQRIYERLFKIGRGPAENYRDACRILATTPPFGATTHLIAHLYREIESALRDVLTLGEIVPANARRQETEKVLNDFEVLILSDAISNHDTVLETFNNLKQ